MPSQYARGQYDTARCCLFHTVLTMDSKHASLSSFLSLLLFLWQILRLSKERELGE